MQGADLNRSKLVQQPNTRMYTAWPPPYAAQESSLRLDQELQREGAVEGSDGSLTREARRRICM